ncbi:MAG: hypothetical protein ABMB14_40495, partial [Myxococcota bacterium]
MPVRDPWLVGAALVGVLAALQLVLARWRDLGPTTIAAAGILAALSLPLPRAATSAIVGHSAA